MKINDIKILNENELKKISQKPKFKGKVQRDLIKIGRWKNGQVWNNRTVRKGRLYKFL